MGNNGPLAGVKILDLTRVLSGPLATAWLSDMGAEVIKLEQPGVGEQIRVAEPIINGESAYFATLNRNKRTITLDLKNEKGKEIFLRLVQDVDVVTENFRPDVMERLGLGYERLRSVNPRIVLASLSGYGSNSPYADRAAYDTISQGMGGIMSITGFPDAPPTKCGPSIGDVSAGMNLVIGVLAALYHARETGEGQHVEVALVDSVLALCTQDFIEYGVRGHVPGRTGNHYRNWCPYGTYKAKDGYYQLGVGTDRHYRDLCVRVLDRPDMPEDERYATQPQRVRHRSEVEAVLNEWAAERTVQEVVAALNAANVPASPVYDLGDVSRDEHFTVHRQMIRHMEHPVIGDVPYVNMPVRFSATPLVEPRPSAALGEHNQEVYESIGLSKDDLMELRKAGTI